MAPLLSVVSQQNTWGRGTTSNTVYVPQSPPTMQQIVPDFFHFHFRHVSALNGNLQVSYYAKIATLH
jgi:hypothetical protein